MWGIEVWGREGVRVYGKELLTFLSFCSFANWSGPVPILEVAHAGNRVGFRQDLFSSLHFLLFICLFSFIHPLLFICPSFNSALSKQGFSLGSISLSIEILRLLF